LNQEEICFLYVPFNTFIILEAYHLHNFLFQYYIVPNSASSVSQFLSVYYGTF